MSDNENEKEGRNASPFSGFFDALVEAGREVERHTKDKTESRVEEIKERVRHHTGETMEKMEKAFDDRLNKALSRLGLPNKREVEELEQRVQELTSALSKAEEDVHASPESEAPKRRSRKKS